jgi:DNA-binding GntR family transcriptional regulator
MSAKTNSLRPISARTSLANEAFGKLVEAITSGEFEPGERLSEAELARQLGISRGPLREALGRLEGRLVTRTPRIGVRVIEFSRGDLEQLFFVREALEGMAARLAAERMTAKELDQLGGLLSQHATQPELAAGEAYLQRSGDEDFHFAIARASRCDRIEQLLLDEVYYQLRIHRLKSSTQPGRARAALTEHHQILGALQARNPDLAETAMRLHIRNARFSAIAAAPHVIASPHEQYRHASR